MQGKKIIYLPSFIFFYYLFRILFFHSFYLQYMNINSILCIHVKIGKKRFAILKEYR